MSGAVRVEMGTPCGDRRLAPGYANHGQNSNCIEEHSHTYETRSMILRGPQQADLLGRLNNGESRVPLFSH
jgi:hypothetical protein